MTVRFGLALVVALACFAPTIAQAADAASLTCIEQELGAEAAAKIQNDIGTGLIAGRTIQDMFDGSVLDAPLRTCQKRYSWGDTAQSMAFTYAKAHLLRPAIERALRTGGVDPATVQSVYNELPIKTRRALGMFETEDVREQASVDAVKALMARKVPLQDARGIGRLMAALAVLEFSAGELSKA
jgi:hypothetical protein